MSEEKKVNVTLKGVELKEIEDMKKRIEQLEKKPCMKIETIFTNEEVKALKVLNRIVKETNEKLKQLEEKINTTQSILKEIIKFIGTETGFLKHAKEFQDWLKELSGEVNNCFRIEKSVSGEGRSQNLAVDRRKTSETDSKPKVFTPFNFTEEDIEKLIDEAIITERKKLIAEFMEDLEECLLSKELEDKIIEMLEKWGERAKQ